MGGGEGLEAVESAEGRGFGGGNGAEFAGERGELRSGRGVEKEGRRRGDKDVR